MYSLFFDSPVVCGSFVFDPCFVVQYFESSLVLHEIAFCLTFTVFQIVCCCYSSLPLPHSAMVWSVVCDCGIF